MRRIQLSASGPVSKQPYQRPRLIKYGHITHLTLKGGSLLDADMSNTYQG